MEHGWVGPNPAKGIEAFDEEERERFIQPEEFPKFWSALHSQETKADFRDFVLLALFTAPRKRNLLSASWPEINFQSECWIIPGTKTKNGKPLTIELVKEAIEIFKRRKAQATTEWVFPSSHPLRKSKSGHFEEPKSQWNELLYRAGFSCICTHPPNQHEDDGKCKDCRDLKQDENRWKIFQEVQKRDEPCGHYTPNLRLHDLRRTNGSFQAAQGASEIVIGKSLGHLNRASTAVYARLVRGPVRESMTAAHSAMVALRRKPRRKPAA